MNEEERRRVAVVLEALEEVIRDHNVVLPEGAIESFTDWYWTTVCVVMTRYSTSTFGQMTTIAVEEDTVPPTGKGTLPMIRLWSNNECILPYTKKMKIPEAHAEQRLIATAAARGTALAGSTLYITFPPCATCFVSILHSGITRCVHRRQLRLPYGTEAAKAHHLSFTGLSPSPCDELRVEVAKLVWQTNLMKKELGI